MMPHEGEGKNVEECGRAQNTQQKQTRGRKTRTQNREQESQSCFFCTLLRSSAFFYPSLSWGERQPPDASASEAIEIEIQPYHVAQKYTNTRQIMACSMSNDDTIATSYVYRGLNISYICEGI
jgi:hypothetical protein